MLGGSCSVCGSKRNLEIHHLDMRYDNHRSAWMNMNDAIKEPEKVKLLCKKHHKEVHK